MPYVIERRVVAPELIAAARGRSARRDVAKTMLALLDRSWAYVREHAIPNDGINVAIYAGDGSGVAVEAGARVRAPFEPVGAIVCAATPGGLVATTAHIGPYERLGDAHAAIVAWCAANGHRLAGISWEVYGHWSDDPGALRTDIYYALDA